MVDRAVDWTGRQFGPGDESVIEKRDGRREWLRSVKTARSIVRAAEAAGPGSALADAELDEFAVTAIAIELARRVARERGARWISAEVLSESVQAVLAAGGRHEVANVFAAERVRRDRRARVLRRGNDLSVDPVAAGGGRLAPEQQRPGGGR
jgi:hypothetical protein